MNENATPAEVLSEWLKKKPGNAPIRHRLRPYEEAGISEIGLYLVAEGLPGSQKQYYPVAADKPLKESLKGRTIIEFPVVVVGLPSEKSTYRIATETPQLTPWDHTPDSPPDRLPVAPEEAREDLAAPANHVQEVSIETSAEAGPLPCSPSKRQKIREASSVIPGSGFSIARDGSIVRAAPPVEEIVEVTQANADEENRREEPGLAGVLSVVQAALLNDVQVNSQGQAEA